MKKKQQGFFLNPFYPSLPPGDPYFSDVSLLLRFDGTNGTNAFIDSSSSPKLVTSVNQAVHSTAQFKFGTGSLWLPNSNSGAQLPTAGTSFSTRNFTLEFWHRPDNALIWRTLFTTYNNADNTEHLGIQRTQNNTGLLEAKAYSHGVGYFAGATSLHSLPLQQWSHIALVRDGEFLWTYVNGIRSYQSINVGTGYFEWWTSHLGGRDNGLGATGYYDDFRITMDRVRYTANFAVPTTRFPNY